MKKPRKKNNNLARARAGVKGLIIEWEDRDPLAESEPNIIGKASHKNPVFNLCAHKVYNDFGEWIRHHQPFHWLVTITMVAEYPNGAQQNEIREVEAYTTLNKISDHCLDAVENAFLHINTDYYKTTFFKAECVDVADRRKKKANKKQEQAA